jgi:hypothetical protein
VPVAAGEVELVTRAVTGAGSPVWVEVDGRPVCRPASARWLLDWLDRFEALLAAHGRFADDAQRAEVTAVVDRARAVYRALAGPDG